MEPISSKNKKSITPDTTIAIAAAEVINFNPFLPEFNTDPYPTYERLRLEDPIHWSFLDMWVLTRYADVKAVLGNSCFRSNPVPERVKQKGQYLKLQQENLNLLAQMSGNWLLFIEPPDHSRLRGLLSKVFSAKGVEVLRPQIQKIVNELLEKVQQAKCMDIISDIRMLLLCIIMDIRMLLLCIIMDIRMPWTA